jgi:hypothetical protein
MLPDQRSRTTNPATPRVQYGGRNGVEGNARLTGALGSLLLLLLFVEGVTILRIRALITVHIFVGLLLVPPVLAKIGSTTYRFVRYYTGQPGYVRKGPPAPLLRLAGPLTIASTVVLFASGIALLAVTPDRPGLLLLVHKASFIVWFGLMSLHVLAHVREVTALAWRDWRPGSGPRSGPRSLRRGVVVVSLVLGVALGAALLPLSTAWTHGRSQGTHQGR